MTTHSIFYVGDNTHFIEVRGPNGVGGLQDQDGNLQIDASVNLTALVEKRSGNTVAGVSLPLPVPHVAGGVYRAALNGLSIVAGRTYLATVDVIGSQGFEAEWQETVIAKVRRA